MSKPPKIDRKDLSRPDEFVQQGTHLLELVLGHQKKILSGIATVAVIALGFYFYQWRVDSKNETGWKEYAEVIQKTDTEKWEGLKKIAEKYSSVPVGQYSAVQLADHYFDEAKKQSGADANSKPMNVNLAVQWYSEALKYSKLSPGEKGLLLVNRASAHELEQKWDDAMRDYVDAISLGFEGKPIALLGQARIYELKNEPGKAIEVYQKLSADFLNTEYGRMAKNYLRRLKSPLFSGAKS
ncbi:MAG: hypothetical protein EBR01_01930 [Proteobacteria bacterium]|nr:hypothetical protein [Pseudomonadota bacterium]NBY20522.1 hypothetical protein [bacterium]